MSDTDFPLPPATFSLLAASLKAQAEMHMGLLHFGEEQDRPQPDLRLTRHTIDMLAMLEEKTRNNLTIEEQRFIENSLTELRFRYVQAIEREKTAAQVSEPAAETPESEGQAGA
jgi:hypothetical protein